jgi:hypothetical protein
LEADERERTLRALDALLEGDAGEHQATFAFLKESLDEASVLRRFDEVRARIREHTAGFSEEKIAADVAAARAELPD